MATRPELHHPARLNGLALALALCFGPGLAWAGPVAPADALGQVLRLAAAPPSIALPAPVPVPVPVPTPAAVAKPAVAAVKAPLPVPTPVAVAPTAPTALTKAAPVKVAAAPAAALPAVATPMPSAPASPGSPRAERKAPKALAVGCIISPERVAEIGSPVVGIVRELKVDSGDTVRGGQPLLTLQSDVENAGVQAAQARSQIDADVRAADANLELARQRHERAIELQSKGFVSGQAIDQARAELEVASQRLQQARGQQVVAQRELGVVRAQLDQRVVRSPFDGVVTERYVNLGERVEDRPLMRLAMLDPLRVELVLPAHRYGSVARNDLLSVQPDLPDTAPVSARVSHVDKVIDAASNTFRVRLRLPNPGHHLPAGARCKLLDAADTARTAPPAIKAAAAPAAASAIAPATTLIAPSAVGAKPSQAVQTPAPKLAQASKPTQRARAGKAAQGTRHAKAAQGTRHAKAGKLNKLAKAKLKASGKATRLAKAKAGKAVAQKNAVHKMTRGKPALRTVRGGKTPAAAA